MQTFIFLFASLAVSMASKAMVAKDFKEGEVLELCKKSGEFLLHPTNRCKYIRCTFGDEPWQDDEGNYKFYPTVQDCPYGTAVSRSFYGHQGYGYGSEGEDLDVSRLCTDRVHRQNAYGHSPKTQGYDQCNVEQSYGYVHPTYQTYGPQSYGKHGYGSQGYTSHGGYAYPGTAYPPQTGYVPAGYAHPGFALPGYAHAGYAHVNFAYPRYVSYPVPVASAPPKEIQYPTH